MYTGPHSVSKNLVLSLDAANIKSFPGEPTTNIFVASHPYFASAYNGSSYGFDDANAKISQSGITIDGVRATKIYRSITGTGVTQSDYLNFDYAGYVIPASGNSKTYSFDYYGTKGKSIYFYVNAGTTTYSSTIPGCTISASYIRIPVPENTWFRVDVTLTNTYGPYSISWMVLHEDIGPTSLSNIDYYIFKNVQIEMLNHPTRYVNGTRGTTVATGGGWKDLSGNSNNGTLVNGPTYNSGSTGSIVFDGVDDYIDDTNGFPINGNMTTEIIFKRNSDDAIKTLSTHLRYRASTNPAQMYFLRTCVGGSNYGDSAWANSVGLHSSNNIILSAITHLTYTHDVVSGVWCAYFNGYLTRTITVDPATYGGLNETSTFRIGTGPWAPMAANVYLYRNYNRVLSASEILQNYYATKSRYIQ